MFNSGVFVLKNSPWSQRFLNSSIDMLAAPMPQLCCNKVKRSPCSGSMNHGGGREGEGGGKEGGGGREVGGRRGGGGEEGRGCGGRRGGGEGGGGGRGIRMNHVAFPWGEFPFVTAQPQSFQHNQWHEQSPFMYLAMVPSILDLDTLAEEEWDHHTPAGSHPYADYVERFANKKTVRGGLRGEAAPLTRPLQARTLSVRAYVEVL